MKKSMLLFFVLLFLSVWQLQAQEALLEKRVKTITEFNVEHKKKVLDHVTCFNGEGQKIEETEYYSDGRTKSKILYEYDSQKRCVKATRYGQKGKIEKVTTIEYDADGQKILESSYFPEQRYRTDKVFEYTWQ